MAVPASRRVLLVAVGLLAACAGVAFLARWVLAERYPRQGGEWWRPAESPPTLDPEALARAAQKRQAQAFELAERRERVRAIPEGLKGGTAVVQFGHTATAIGWYGRDLVTAGTDATARVWRPAPGGPGLLFALPLPAGLPLALAGDAEGKRLWVALDPDELVVRSGDSLEVEHRHRLLGSRGILDLALADGGTRAVALVRTPGHGAEPAGWGLRHLVAPDGLPLKSVPLAAGAPVLGAALSPDGERVALLLAGSASPALELRRTDDGAVVASTPLLWAGWVSPGAAAGERATIALGPDFVAVQRRGGTAVWELAADGAAGAEPAWAMPSDDGPDDVRLEACAGALLEAGRSRGGVWVVSRGASGWTRRALEAPEEVSRRDADNAEGEGEGPRAETQRARGGIPEGGGPAWVLACSDAARVAAAGVGGIEVRSPEGEGRMSTVPGRVEAAIVPGEEIVRLAFSGSAAVHAVRAEVRRPDDLPGPDRTFDLDLRTLTIEWNPVDGAVRAVGAADGAAIVERDGGFWSVDGGEARRIGDAAGAECRVLRGGVSAVRREDSLELFGPGGETVGSWRLPEWLGTGDDRVSLARDGRSAVVTTAGGFAVFAAGEASPVLYFPAEGYFDAPAEFLVASDLVAIGRNDGILEIWSVSSGEVELEFTGFGAFAGRPTVLWASDDGEALLAGSSRGAVAAWHTRTGNELWGEFPFEGPVTTVVTASGAPWVLASDGRTVSLLSRGSGDLLLTFAIDREGDWLATTPDGYHVSSGSGGEALLGLRFWQSPGPEDAAPFRLVTAGDVDLASLGDALDALRVTLIGAGEEGGER